MHLCLLEEFNDMAVVNMLLGQKKVNSTTKEHAWTAEAATDIDAMMTRLPWEMKRSNLLIYPTSISSD